MSKNPVCCQIMKIFQYQIKNNNINNMHLLRQLGDR